MVERAAQRGTEQRPEEKSLIAWARKPHRDWYGLIARGEASSGRDAGTSLSHRAPRRILVHSNGQQRDDVHWELTV